MPGNVCININCLQTYNDERSIIIYSPRTWIMGVIIGT